MSDINSIEVISISIFVLFSSNTVEQLDLCDHTQSLCTTIEAIFLHGLKDSFLWQTIHILAGGVDRTANRRPSPTFWAPLLVFSHKYAIEQIQSMAQITTEIGYCRCWIRQSLNDCLLSSYISNMRKNPQALAPYYQRTAFIRDPDSMELAESLIGGVEACVSFQLPLNSSLLNQWTDLPLQLSGLYTPNIQTCPIASGIDVANTNALLYATEAKPSTASQITQIGEDAAHIFIEQSISIPKPLQTNEFFSASIHNSPFRESTMNSRKNPFMIPYTEHEDDADDIEEIAGDAVIDDDIEHDVQLAALLSRVDALASEVEPEVVSIESKNELAAAAATQSGLNDDVTDPLVAESGTPPQMGNSIVSRMGWSSTTDEPTVVETTDQTSAKTALSRSSSIRSPVDRHSYNSLLRRGKSTQDDGLYTRQIDFDDVWQRFEGSLGLNKPQSTAGSQDGNDVAASAHDASESPDDGFDFEFVRADNLSTKFALTELREMVQQTFKIARELGLESQNYACLSCSEPLGVGGIGQNNTTQYVGSLQSSVTRRSTNRVSFFFCRVCAFNGSYYCSACMASDAYQIPARVIFNWDFRKYPVSQKAAAFLLEFQYQPFIDLKLLNPSIYQYVDEMAELQSLRIQLNFIRAYLFTCCAPIIETLRKQLWTREYLYEHIHRYTLADLQRIPKRILADQLRKVVTFGRQHINDCPLCSQKGFICEICQSDKVLYPFDIDTTYKVSGRSWQEGRISDSK